MKQPAKPRSCSGSGRGATTSAGTRTWTGVTAATAYQYSPGCPNASIVLGRPAQVATVAGLLLVCVSLVAAVRAYVRGPDEPGRLAVAAAACVLAFVVFGKVLSPQYLSWLLPLVPLVQGRRRGLAVGLFLAAVVLTQVETSNGDLLAALRWPVWVLLARNLVLVLLLGTLPASLRERRAPNHESVTRRF